MDYTRREIVTRAGQGFGILGLSGIIQACAGQIRPEQFPNAEREDIVIANTAVATMLRYIAADPKLTQDERASLEQQVNAIRGRKKIIDEEISHAYGRDILPRFGFQGTNPLKPLEMVERFDQRLARLALAGSTDKYDRVSYEKVGGSLVVNGAETVLVPRGKGPGINAHKEYAHQLIADTYRDLTYKMKMEFSVVNKGGKATGLQITTYAFENQDVLVNVDRDINRIRVITETPTEEQLEQKLGKSASSKEHPNLLAYQSGGKEWLIAPLAAIPSFAILGPFGIIPTGIIAYEIYRHLDKVPGGLHVVGNPLPLSNRDISSMLNPYEEEDRVIIMQRTPRGGALTVYKVPFIDAKYRVMQNGMTLPESVWPLLGGAALILGLGTGAFTIGKGVGRGIRGREGAPSGNNLERSGGSVK